jgi:putative SOS response-associated peptidase YedK
MEQQHQISSGTQFSTYNSKSRSRSLAITVCSNLTPQLAGIWENWQRWVRTFAIITTNSNELAAAIHDRMPVIIAPKDYDRWLSPLDPDPRDLLVPYP